MAEIPTTVEPATDGEVLEHILQSQAGRFPTIPGGDSQTRSRTDTPTKGTSTTDLFEQQGTRNSVGSLLGVGREGVSSEGTGGTTGDISLQQFLASDDTNGFSLSAPGTTIVPSEPRDTRGFQASQDEPVAGRGEDGANRVVDTATSGDLFSPQSFDRTATNDGGGPGAGPSETNGIRGDATSPRPTFARIDVPSRPPVQDRSGTSAVPQQPLRSPANPAPQRPSGSPQPQRAAQQPAPRPGQHNPPMQQSRSPGMPVRPSPNTTGTSPADQVKPPTAPHPTDVKTIPGTQPVDKTRLPTTSPADQVKPPPGTRPADARPSTISPADVNSPIQAPDVQPPKTPADSSPAVQQPVATPDVTTGTVDKHTPGTSDKQGTALAPAGDKSQSVQPSDAGGQRSIPRETLNAADVLQAIEASIRGEADGKQRLEWLEQSGLLPEIFDELARKGIIVELGQEGEGTRYHVASLGATTGKDAGTIILDPLNLKTPELLPWILREEATHAEQWMRGDMPDPLDQNDPDGLKFAQKLLDLEAEANYRVLQAMQEYEARGGTLPFTQEFQKYVEARGGRNAVLDDVKTRLLDGTLIPAHGLGKTYLEYYQQQCLRIREAHDRGDTGGLDMSRGASASDMHPLLKELPPAVLPEIRKLIDSNQITRGDVLRIADTYLALRSALDARRLGELMQTLPYSDIFSSDTPSGTGERARPYLSNADTQSLNDAMAKLLGMASSSDVGERETFTKMLRGEITPGECFHLLGLRPERYALPALLVMADIVDANDIRRALRTWDIVRHYPDELLKIFMALKPAELRTQLLRPPQNMELVTQSWQWLQDTFKGNTLILEAFALAKPAQQVKLLSSTSNELRHFAEAHLLVTNLAPELKLLLAEMTPDKFLSLMMDDDKGRGTDKVKRVAQYWLALHGQLSSGGPRWLRTILGNLGIGLTPADSAVLQDIGQAIIPKNGLSQEGCNAFIEFALAFKGRADAFDYRATIDAWKAWGALPQGVQSALVGTSQERLTAVLSRGKDVIVRMGEVWKVIESGRNGGEPLPVELQRIIMHLSGKPLETLLARGEVTSMVSRWQGMNTLLGKIQQRFESHAVCMLKLNTLAKDAFAHPGRAPQVEIFCRQMLPIVRALEHQYHNNEKYSTDLTKLDALVCRVVFLLHQPSIDRNQVEQVCREMTEITGRLLKANGDDIASLTSALTHLGDLHNSKPAAFAAWLASGLPIYELAEVLHVQHMNGVMYEIQFVDLWSEQRPQAEQIWFRMHETGSEAPLSPATRMKLECLGPKDLREIFMGTLSVERLAGRTITLTDGTTKVTFTRENIREIRHLLLPIAEQKHLTYMYARLEQEFAKIELAQQTIRGLGSEGQDTLKTYRRLMNFDPEILDNVLLNSFYINRMMLHVTGIEPLDREAYTSIFKKLTLNADLPLLFPPDDRSHSYRTGDITRVVTLLRNEANHLTSPNAPTFSEEMRHRLFVLGPRHLRAAEIVFRQQMTAYLQDTARRKMLWQQAHEMTAEKQAILERVRSGLSNSTDQEYLVARHRLESMPDALRSFMLMPEQELSFERIALIQMLVHPEDLRPLLQQLTTRPDLSRIGYAQAGWLSVAEWAWRGDPFNVRLVPRVMTDMRTALPLYPSPGHILFLGATRSGKTELLKTLFAQVSTNMSIFMVDPKALELVQALGKKIERTHEVYLYSPTHLEQSVSINPLDFVLSEDVGAARKFAAYWSESFKLQERGGGYMPDLESSAKTILQAAILHLRASEPDAEFYRLTELLRDPIEFQKALMGTRSKAAKSIYTNNIAPLFDNKDDPRTLHTIFRVLRETFSVVEDDRIRQLSARTTLGKTENNRWESTTSTPASVFLQHRICFVLDQSIANLPAYEEYNRFLHDLMLSAIGDNQISADDGTGQKPSYGVMAVTDEAGILAKEYGEPFNRAADRGAYVGGIGAGRTPDGQRVVGTQLVVASQRLPDDSLADQFGQFLIARAVPGDVEKLSRIIGLVRTRLESGMKVEAEGTKVSDGVVHHNIKIGSEQRHEYEESESRQHREGWQEVITSLIDGSFWQKLGRGINLNVQLGKDPSLAESAGRDPIRQRAFAEGFPEFIRRDTAPKDIFADRERAELTAIVSDLQQQINSLSNDAAFRAHPDSKRILADLQSMQARLNHRP